MYENIYECIYDLKTYIINIRLKINGCKKSVSVLKM